MKSVERPKYSQRLRRRTSLGKKPKPNISRNHVLFRFPVKYQRGSNVTQSPILSSQRSLVDTSAIANSLPECPKSEYFVKHKYSLYRMGLQKKHLSEPNTIPQGPPVISHNRKPHIGKVLKQAHSTMFANKVLVNKMHFQSYSTSAEQISNPQQSNRKTTETPFDVAQNDESCFMYSRNKKLKFELCFFYTRFGFCTDKHCRFVHDPEKVFVCRRFISGSCQDPSCKLLHTREKNRMPVCLKFLSGLCGKNSCPFVHVNIGKNAEICEDFVFRGFCIQGQLCWRLHTWDCIEFWKTGQCSDLEKCPLRHKMSLFGKRTRVK
ncbi:hypothetical protein GpartN1_g562.t1 [Galdieria partita]|uniref:C3H1-type domain-containing protein n=1 Tax=Galdieria partita TaxID=83374 RepID=A0A9C7UMY8_9RHOD|nr:hypothetical protein GpartN1_g562.t1 [Galdieria partita]